MNGDELVYDCLRKHGTDEEARRCLQHCGADEELEEILREIDGEETQEKARHLVRKFAVDQEMEEARHKKAGLDSIAESSIWRDPKFLTELSRHFIAKDFEENRKITRHYIDNAGQPARAPNISKMGNPKRGADGRVLRDARGEVIWDTSAEQQFNPTDVNLRNAQENSGQDCGHCIFYRNQDGTCQIVGGLIADNLICDKFTAKPTLEQRALRIQQGTKTMTADGKIDTTKSIMGTPKRNADGSVEWIVK